MLIVYMFYHQINFVDSGFFLLKELPIIVVQVRYL